MGRRRLAQRSVPRARIAWLAAAGLALATLAVPGLAPAKGPHVCSGTLRSPGVLAGTFKNGVVVKGACEVNSGLAHVIGVLSVSRGGVLVAQFGRNHRTHHGGSSLTVTGDVVVNRGAAALLGCKPPESGCIDDPNQNNPTLSSKVRISGNLLAINSLAVQVHGSAIGGDVNSVGGGGSQSCAPAKSGVFALFMSPVFSAYEDSTVGGNLVVTGLNSCWIGVARTRVGGSIRLANDKLGDPDAIEVLSNHVRKDLVCKGNSRVWDSSETTMTGLFPRRPEPNKVGGKRIGQCRLASPTTQGGKSGPGPF